MHPFPNLYSNYSNNCNESNIFWNCFRQALDVNKRGHDGKRRILSIIAGSFSYNTLMEKLKVSFFKKKSKKIKKKFGNILIPL